MCLLRLHMSHTFKYKKEQNAILITRADQLITSLQRVRYHIPMRTFLIEAIRTLNGFRTDE